MDLLLVIVTLLLTVLHESSACSCMPGHIQAHYCQSDFIIVATVKSVKEIYRSNDLPQSTELQHPELFGARIPYERRFTVRIHRTYKGMENKDFRMAIKKFIYSYGSGAACGVNLNVQQTYILSGTIRNRTLRINLCNWIQNHKKLQNQQKKFLKFMYRKNCGCTVATCFGSYCNTPRGQNPKKMCSYSPNFRNDCYQKHGLCVATDGVCQWKKNNKFKICLKGNGQTFPWKKYRKRANKTMYKPAVVENAPDVVGYPGFQEP